MREQPTSYHHVAKHHPNWGLGSLFRRQGESAKARIMYSKALVGYEKVLGHNHLRCQDLRKNLSALGAEA
jgi:hypothetical protein